MLKNRPFRVLLTLGFVVFALACRGSGQAAGPFRELEFAVDSSRLGAEISIGDISLHAPNGWEPADTSLMNAVRSRIEADTGAFGVDLLAVCLNPASGGILMITGFRNPPAKNEGFVPWARQFVEQYRAARPDVPVEEDWIKLGAISAVQLYPADSLRVQFKYVLDAPSPLGLDYVVPKSHWEAEVRSVESSLGTIH
ncbi:MAG: hypothetical protein ACOZB3_08970 [Calditrichota bacterium]